MPLERRISRRTLLGLVDAPASYGRDPTGDGSRTIPPLDLDRTFPLRSGLTARPNTLSTTTRSSARFDERVLRLSDGSLSIRQIAHRLAEELSLAKHEAVRQTMAALERLHTRRLIFCARAGAARLQDRIVEPSEARRG